MCWQAPKQRCHRATQCAGWHQSLGGQTPLRNLGWRRNWTPHPSDCATLPYGSAPPWPACAGESATPTPATPCALPPITKKRWALLPPIPGAWARAQAVRAALAADGALAPFRSVALRLAPTDEAAVAPALEALRSEFDGRVAVGSYPVGPMDWRLCAQPCLDAALDARVGVDFDGGVTVGSYPVGLPARRLHTRLACMRRLNALPKYW